MNEPVSGSELDNFADLDFGNSNNPINLDFNLQNFDDLEIDSSIDSSSLNLDLDFLNSSEPSADFIFDDNALPKMLACTFCQLSIHAVQNSMSA